MNTNNIKLEMPIYKGIDKASKKTVYGGLVYIFQIDYTSNSYDDVPPRCHYIVDSKGEHYEVELDLVEEYIGLNDSNNKKIFTGDKVLLTKYLGGNFIDYTHREYYVRRHRFGFHLVPLEKNQLSTTSLYIGDSKITIIE